MLKIYDFNLYKMMDHLEIKDSMLFLYYPKNLPDKQPKRKIKSIGRDEISTYRESASGLP